jgi:hypothetical protein
MFQDNPSVPSSRAKQSQEEEEEEDGTDSLSQNVGTELPWYAVLYPRRA